MTSNHRKRITRVLPLLAGVGLINACANAPTHSTLRGIPHGNSISVVEVGTDVETPNAKSAGGTVAGGTARGAAAGAGYGAGAGFMMGFACGPLFVICSPIGVVGGVAGGAIFGAAVGGVDSAMSAMPKEKAEALEAVMAGTIADFTESQTLVAHFKSQSGDRWNIRDEGAPIEISLGIEGLAIDQGKNDMLMVKVVNWMMVSYSPEESDTTEPVLFTYVSRQHHVDYWIEDDGANFREAVNEAFEANIAKMLEQLEGYPGR